MRLFDFGRNYAKNYASIIRQGLVTLASVTLCLWRKSRTKFEVGKIPFFESASSFLCSYAELLHNIDFTSPFAHAPW